ncbi:MAG TPA: nucleotidyltransferase [Chitinophagaceae bacterium]|nr:nucleotidyltransferase [Chitinophagaceae bacterium]HAN37419.1 nucleotidyltransferase [Chitinophagaceae bacterium]
MQPTLVILAAGMASRYGSMKQTQSFGPSGETIMEYSIYDAIKAGFKKVVFIIREDFAETFKSLVEPKLAGKIEIDYVFQKLESFTEGHQIPAERTKPWGTAHALLCCKGTVNEPFAVINADDFYGRDAFEKAANFLQNKVNDGTWAVIAYHLKNTLSENGSVSRGVIDVSAAGDMAGINERTKVYGSAEAMFYEDETGEHALPNDSVVSMNMFCFANSFISLSENMFQNFLTNNIANPKSEFFIPLVVDGFIKQGHGVVNVVPTEAKWFGVTYKEDAPIVQQSIDALVQSGVYPNNLWA